VGEAETDAELMAEEVGGDVVDFAHRDVLGARDGVAHVLPFSFGEPWEEGSIAIGGRGRISDERGEKKKQHA
jgi:hypothetical protein